MNIFYDGYTYQAQAAGGINRYFENIISRLPKDFTPTLMVPEVPRLNLPPHPRLQIRTPKVRFAGRIGNRLRRYEYRDLQAHQRFDLAHPTYYFLLTRRRLQEYKCPVVLTVWDMVHEIFPALMDRDGYVARTKRAALQAAQQLLCISENTKRDLLERFPNLENKVTVTPLATGITEALCIDGYILPEHPYYLYVGSRIGYKNFAFQLSALSKVIERHPERILCVVGGPFTEAERQVMRDLRLDERHVRLLGHVEDAELACLYRGSLALVYPSLYEGFGIPPLEAMSCGTPVVACNTSSIPEVVGDAALLFAPDALDDFVDMMLSVSEKPLRSILIAKGRKRASLFSWERTAAQTMEVYHTLTA